jgi:hypothetical protein
LQCIAEDGPDSLRGAGLHSTSKDLALDRGADVCVGYKRERRPFRCPRTNVLFERVQRHRQRKEIDLIGLGLRLPKKAPRFASSIVNLGDCNVPRVYEIAPARRSSSFECSEQALLVPELGELLGGRGSSTSQQDRGVAQSSMPLSGFFPLRRFAHLGLRGRGNLLDVRRGAPSACRIDEPGNDSDEDQDNEGHPNSVSESPAVANGQTATSCRLRRSAWPTLLQAMR